MQGRIRNDGDYEPGNVRWSTNAEQNRNTVRTINLTINGETRCATDWAAISGVPKTVICWRLRNGVPAEIAVFRPAQHRKPLPRKS